MVGLRSGELREGNSGAARLDRGAADGKGKAMGLPKPLGKYTVAFGDFELRRIDEKLPNAESPNAPPFRVFYPTNAMQPSSWGQLGSRAWLPDLHYTFGFCCAMVAPTTAFRRMILWVMASMCAPSCPPSVSCRVSCPVSP